MREGRITASITKGTVAAAALAISVTAIVVINQAATNKTAIQGAATVEQTEGTITFTATANKPVLDQLKQHAAVETKETAYGPLVESINGQKNKNGMHWVFYVDGHLAQRGPADYTAQGGETIQWRLE